MAQVPGRAGDAGLNAAALPRASGASKSLLEKLTISQLGLPVLDCVEVAFNTTIASGQAFGGQAEVFFATWQEYAGYSTGLIPAGTKVAIKVIRSHAGGGQFKAPEGRLEMHIADRVSRNAQRIELNLLALLHAGGCGARIVQPLAVFNYPGEWVDDPERRARCIWQPMNGYVMKAYPLGSLSILLQDICYRRVPESVGQRFLNLRTMSAEYAAMLRELHNIHTKPAVRMMIQDLTPGNLLVEDTPDGMRLLLADPAMAQPIKLLQEKGRRSALCGTWLWGSMLVRNRRFDPSADLYSLSISFAEAWLVAEGAVEYAGDLIVLINADLDKARGVQFMRRLVWEVLRLHHQNTINIKPRVQRHLPVSWLGAWLLLLGFRDYACEQHMRQGLPCLRPSEEAVLEAAQLWARIAAAAEELPPSLTEEQALSPACKAIVDDMAQLLQKLVGLSHLSDAGEQEDPALAWCAANFMEQKHPLVAAMKARGATGVGQPDPPRSYKVEAGDWWDAIRAAHHGALLGRPPARSDDQQGEFQEQLQEGERAARTLKELGQWYQGLKHKMAKGAIPVDLYDQLQPPPACRLALELAAEAAATASPAAGEQAPAAVGAAQTAENVASLGEAAGKSGTASPLPHPGTPQLLHVVEGPTVQSVGGLLIPAPSPLGSAPTVAMQPDPFKGGSDKASAKEQRTEAYAKALEELLTLDRVPAPDDVFAPLRTREQVLAFLRWWAVDGPKPSIPGMQFSNKHKSQFVRPVMDKDTPGHGLKAESRDGTWGRRLVLVKDAALTVLRRLEQEQQQQLETNH
ncbi:serine threonine- kinase ATG1 [Chlorella sorokiniana]|uniref:Serine threonine-kinase ATG1 n=1 Tax=Chlorella sorokiniana TaxID=3076 RepID=A0A2P6TVJ2_CHLSO|nr:serine threonine- kinase ATG1 [Chlorella sorokiniana]|eukprot:PRW58085.1 serine threonine- kinase ATG1 [Chlorella sorokiniana]